MRRVNWLHRRWIARPPKAQAVGSGEPSLLNDLGCGHRLALSFTASWLCLAAPCFALVAGCNQRTAANSARASSAIFNMGQLEVGTNRQGRDIDDRGVQMVDAIAVQALATLEALYLVSLS